MKKWPALKSTYFITSWDYFINGDVIHILLTYVIGEHTMYCILMFSYSVELLDFSAAITVCFFRQHRVSYFAPPRNLDLFKYNKCS